MMWQPRADHEQKQDLGDVTITQGLDATTAHYRSTTLAGMRNRASTSDFFH